MTENSEKTKDTLLHFASSELTSHASNLIGISILLFSYLNVATQRFPRIKIVVSSESINFLSLKIAVCYSVLYVIFWLLNTGIIFSVMRLIYYGKYANEMIRREYKAKTLTSLNDEVGKKVRELKFLKCIPLGWFSGGLSEFSTGFQASLIAGAFVSLLLFCVFFVS